MAPAATVRRSPAAASAPLAPAGPLLPHRAKAGALPNGAPLGAAASSPQDAVPVVDFAPFTRLRLWAEMLYDVQQNRIAAGNRLKRASVTGDAFAAAVALTEAAERRLKLELRREFRRVAPAPVLAWVKDTKGLGIDSMARLLGHLGHPRVAHPAHWEGSGSERALVWDEPYLRTVGQLWAYCGHGAIIPVHTKMSAAEMARRGDPMCKMVTHLVAESAVKEPRARDCSGAEPPVPTPSNLHALPMVEAGGWVYRAVYDRRRAATAGRVHGAECVRCGPRGHPAAPGSPWSKAHAHADALRIVGKTILRDLWVVWGDPQ